MAGGYFSKYRAFSQICVAVKFQGVLRKGPEEMLPLGSHLAILESDTKSWESPGKVWEHVFWDSWGWQNQVELAGKPARQKAGSFLTRLRGQHGHMANPAQALGGLLRSLRAKERSSVSERND